MVDIPPMVFFPSLLSPFHPYQGEGDISCNLILLPFVNKGESLITRSESGHRSLSHVPLSHLSKASCALVTSLEKSEKLLLPGFLQSSRPDPRPPQQQCDDWHLCPSLLHHTSDKNGRRNRAVFEHSRLSGTAKKSLDATPLTSFWSTDKDLLWAPPQPFEIYRKGSSEGELDSFASLVLPSQRPTSCISTGSRW